MLLAATQELKRTGHFTEMDIQTDEDEHSIEMHLPYVRKVFEGSVVFDAATYFCAYITHLGKTSPSCLFWWGQSTMTKSSRTGGFWPPT